MTSVEYVDMLRVMNERHERLRQARQQAGFRSAQAAADALGVSGSTYRAHENGQNDFSLDEAAVYARKFNADPIWIMTGEHVAGGAFTNPQVDSPNAMLRGAVEGQGIKIPLYGRAVGGVDGEFEMNGSLLGQVLAPPSLAGIKGVYAVQVAGTSMYPRYDDGETCFVDPKYRVKKGDYVVAQIQLEPEGPILAYVKKFCWHNNAELVLEQFNPPKQLRFDARSVVSVHYISLAGNA